MNKTKLKAVEADIPTSGFLCRLSFKYFVQVFHYYTFRKPFIFKPFHLEIIEKLEGFVFGTNEKRNLLINIPPRMGKSQIMQYFIAWGYAINPQSNYILTSYGNSLVLKFSDVVKSIIESKLYKEMFNIELDKKNSAKEFWKIEKGGELRATSMGGTITGFGAGIMEEGWGGALILDDPLKADDYKSEIELQNCIDFYTNTLKSRLNNDKTPIILIMQRLNVDDLTGYINNNELKDWDWIKYQGLNENTGAALWEDKIPSAKLLGWKKTLPFFYYSQYQQEPIILGGSVIKSEWFRYFPLEIKYKYKKLFITGDTAMKVKEHNDYSVFLVCGVTEQGKLHILDMVRGKWEAPDLKRQVKILWNKWVNMYEDCPLTALYIEDKASGTGLIQDIRTEGGLPIIPLIADRDKLTRVESVIAHIEAGNV